LANNSRNKLKIMARVGLAELGNSK